MKNELSGIWRQVIQNTLTDSRQELPFDDLINAAKFVLDAQSPTYAFRRNRELIDLSHRFRFFRFQGTDYVIKRTKPNEIPMEYLNALELDKRIRKLGLTHVNVVVPQLIRSDTDGTIGLLQEDHGFTLYENIAQSRKQLDLGALMKLYGTLLNHGIEWSGWLPRNMFLKDDALWLIDFEDVYFHPAGDFCVSDLTLFKLILGWGQIFEKDTVCAALSEVVGSRKISTAPPDSFEQALAGLLNSKHQLQVRQLGFEITYSSELPLKDHPPSCACLTSMDIGHLMEDILDNDYLSVWYTVGTSKIRNCHGDRVYADYLLGFEYALITWLKDSSGAEHSLAAMQTLQQLSLCLMIRFFTQPDGNIYKAISHAENTPAIFHLLESSCPCVASILDFLRLRSHKGWDAAIARSKDIHRFLSQIYTLLNWSFPSLSAYSLLLRGSCAQGLMSIYSDIDFEISNQEFPMGFLPAENLLSAILSVFCLDHEGSAARPTEIDMISRAGYTRDFHEWTELTIPDTPLPDRGWNNGLFFPDPVWRFYSEYESQKHDLSPKYLFFRIRSIIVRYALLHGVNKVSIDDKIKALCAIPNFTARETLLRMTERCLNCYESPTIDIDEILELNHYIDTLYAQAGIRYCERPASVSAACLSTEGR